MTKYKSKYHLFDVTGIELEYMIVDRNSLNVLPVSDSILVNKNGSPVSSIENGSITWSNELVKHVIELKTSDPVSDFNHVAGDFHKNVIKVNELLMSQNAMLMSTAAHPFMNPYIETVIWDHDFSPIYTLYDQIFSCKGHGWSNLQSTHINLPFSGDEEFGRLHAAIRTLVPILPALCASSPIVDMQPFGYLDSRMEMYKHNQERIPMIAGDIIPEPAFTREDYEQLIFNPIEQAIKPFDRDGILDKYFLNSRGCIARFDRGAIEIRVMDVQESPAVDIAIANLVVEVLKILVSEKYSSYKAQKNINSEILISIMNRCIKDGENAVVDEQEYLALMGLTNSSVKSSSVWSQLFDEVKLNLTSENRFMIQELLKNGTLASRILKSLNHDFSIQNLTETYKLIGSALKNNQMFIP